MTGTGVIANVHDVRADAFTVPTRSPESDGTLTWDATTIVVCELQACGKTGLGYRYTAPPAALPGIVSSGGPSTDTSTGQDD